MTRTLLFFHFFLSLSFFTPFLGDALGASSVFNEEALDPSFVFNEEVSALKPVRSSNADTTAVISSSFGLRRTLAYS